MNLRLAILKNFLASGLSKGSAAAYRVLSISLLLSYLGVTQYGEWLLLSSLPSWLALANMSVGSVAGNGMSMLTAKGDVAGARIIYSTTIVMLLILAGFFGLGLAALLPFIRFDSLLSIQSTSRPLIDLCILLLGLSVILSFFGDTFGSRLRASGLAHQSILANSFMPWLDLAGLWVALILKSGLVGMSAAMLITRALYLIGYGWWVCRQTPQYYFSWASVKRAEILPLARKGFAFQSFPLGNAIVLQGNLYMVNAALGTAAVAIFSTTRTLTRAGNQVLELISQIIWPELSRLLGAGDYVRAAKVHRLAVASSLIGGTASILILWLFGPWIFPIWTRHQITVPPHLLIIFLLPLLTTSIAFCSGVVHAACNEHEGMAVRYLIGTITAVLACYPLAIFFGLSGAALSTLFVDLICVPYVLSHSLYLTHDTWGKFLPGMWTETRLQTVKTFQQIRGRLGLAGAKS